MNDMQLQPQQGAETPKRWKAVFTIVERLGSDKKYWVRIGTAFVNGDQSLTVKLDAMPTNAQLHIRDPDPVPYLSRRPPAESADRGGVS